ncbi:hypothetical protein GUJ93_ZPchr0009g1345 [Zizania palustris]|uniref:Uncharacterized protein n=1 Tax=Zizania palustris TaxID=103762 RepID=A0A8J5RNZ9_ZIZPA|nr:hypothetical protein GUJ93_ZPchr0009g1345 [Zizania palustris]
MERNGYEILLFPIIRNSSHSVRASIDILEINRLRRGLLLDAYIWDQRLCYLDALLKTDNHVSNPSNPGILLDIDLVDHHVDDVEDLDKVFSRFDGEKEWTITKEITHDMATTVANVVEISE